MTSFATAVSATLLTSFFSANPFAVVAASHMAVDSSTRPMARPAHFAELAQPEQSVQEIKFLVATKPEPRP